MAPSNPTRDGFEFIGWFYEDDLFDFDTVINNDITLLGRWNSKSYSLTLPDSVTSDQINNNFILHGTLVVIEIGIVEGLNIDKLIVNNVDVTEYVYDTNKYEFTITKDTEVYVQYEYELFESEIKSNHETSHTLGISDGTINEHLNISKESSLFNVVFNKNSGTSSSIFNNGSNEIRLYPGSGNGGQITITIENGYLIDKIEIEVNGNGGFSVNSSEMYEYSSKSEVINITPANEVTIKNISTKTSTAGQVQINYIKVHYREEGLNLDLTPPVITYNDNGTLIYTLGDIWDKEDVYNWFDVYDAIDGADLIFEIDDDDIIDALVGSNDYRFDKEGTYTLIFKATDQSGNVAIYELNIKVYESLDGLLEAIDYSGFDDYYSDIINSIDVITSMAMLLRNTVEYQKYEDARFVYATYDNGMQAVFYDYPDRDNTYMMIPQTWGSGGEFILDNGSKVKLEREHVWACSDMLIKPINGSSSNQTYPGYALNLDKSYDYRPGNSSRGHYSDLHNLWLSVGSANGTHSNHFYGEEAGPSEAYYLVNSIFYPGEEYIGDIARILFYMTLMYPHLTLVEKGDPNAIEGSIYYGYLDVLLYWNEIDPPSEYEIVRNETIFGLQGNRNPFVDFYYEGFAEKLFIFGDPEVSDELFN